MRFSSAVGPSPSGKTVPGCGDPPFFRRLDVFAPLSLDLRCCQAWYIPGQILRRLGGLNRVPVYPDALPDFFPHPFLQVAAVPRSATLRLQAATLRLAWVVGPNSVRPRPAALGPTGADLQSAGVAGPNNVRSGPALLGPTGADLGVGRGCSRTAFGPAQRCWALPLQPWDLPL